MYINHSAPAPCNGNCTNCTNGYVFVPDPRSNPSSLPPPQQPMVYSHPEGGPTRNSPNFGMNIAVRDFLFNNVIKYLVSIFFLAVSLQFFYICSLTNTPMRCPSIIIKHRHFIYLQAWCRGLQFYLLHLPGLTRMRTYALLISGASCVH